MPAGYYSLTAEAFDSAGVTGTSAPVAVAAVSATSTAPQLHVSGNQLVNAGGTPVVLHGVNRSGGEFGLRAGHRAVERPDGPGVDHRDEELGHHRGPGSAERGLLERGVDP